MARTERPLSKFTRLPLPQIHFPNAWDWLVNELIPAWVKKNYSPKEAWKNKPFNREDLNFFFKGICELSDLFTYDRGRRIPAYFNHPKFRSAYLLYFLPLQAAKFVSVFNFHRQALEAALSHAGKEGTLKIVELGAGPGTGSLSLLLTLMDRQFVSLGDLPPIELYWYDIHAGIMEDGKALVEQLCTHFPKLRGRVSLKTAVSPWWNAVKQMKNSNSLILMGHVLNESCGPLFDEETEENSGVSKAADIWKQLFEKSEGGGTLILEPATRGTSQQLSQLRNGWLNHDLVARSSQTFWGPCLHAFRCPLAQGRDWCHQSVPVEIPGRWFKDFSKKLSTEKFWAKYSYLWLASKDHPAPLPDADVKRVISDSLKQTRLQRSSTVLICEPENPGRLEVPAGNRIHRGDLIQLKPSRPRRGGPAGPLTGASGRRQAEWIKT